MNNLETVQAIYRAFGRGDVPALVEFVQAELEWAHDAKVQAISWAIPHCGRAGVSEPFQSSVDPFTCHAQVRIVGIGHFVDGQQHLTGCRV